jgi:hypothetical protein
MRRWVFPFVCLAVVAQSAVEQRLSKDLYFLASPALKGRGNGYPELDQAADYIAKVYSTLSLKTEMQRIPFVHRIERVEGHALISRGDMGPALEWGKDIEALGFSADTNLKRVPLVFAGYGLSATPYDDLKGLELKGKGVIIARSLPDLPAFKDIPGIERSLYARIQKIRSAGAVAVLVMEEGDAPRPLAKEDGPSQLELPVVSVRAACLIQACGDLKSALARIDETRQPQSRSFDQTPGVFLDLSLKLRRVEAQLPNVATLISGRDPALKHETIVLGAHLDHLGLGERHSRAGAEGKGHVHPGADDNGSGTVAVMELARRLAADPPRRSILILHFSGEEEGLLGSAYWVQHPTVPLPSVKFMVNLDMVGRMPSDKPSLQLGGLGAPKSALERAKNLAPKDVALGHDLGFAVGGSDHMSFGAAKIPTFFFFTGIHTDYHRPTDTPDKINYKGMAQVTDFAEKVVRDLANGETIPAFDPETAKVSAGPGDRSPMRVSFGTIPDFTENALGFRISGVSAGSTAESVGLKSGDIIVAFGEKTVRNIYDYMGALGFYKAGDKVVVKWLRDGKTMEKEATLKGR